MTAQILTLVKTGGMAGRAYVLPRPWESAIDGWLRWLKLGGVSANTMRLRRDHVRCIARRSDTHHPRMLTIAILVEQCSEHDWSREHRRSVRTSLISFGEWAVSNDMMDRNVALQLPEVTPGTPKPKPAPDDVWRDLLAAAPPRERLMARLAGEAGLRRAEIAVVHHDDLIDDGQGYALIVHGKGDKQRVVPVTHSLARDIQGHCDRGYLFPGGIDGHISPRWVGAVISQLMPPGWTLHKLRHRFATRGFAGTGNLRAVQEALGHASVATTQLYTAVSSRDVRSVAEAAADDSNDVA